MSRNKSRPIFSIRIPSDVKQVWHQWFAANGLEAPAPHGMRFDRLAVATAAEGLGVGLEPTLLAERELMTGRLIAPLAGRSTDIRYFGHRLRQRSAVRAFAEWIIAELDVQGNG